MATRRKSDKPALAPGSEYTIFENVEGWQGQLTVGIRGDGKPDRRKRRGKDRTDVMAKLVALQQQVMAQELPKAGKPGKLDALLIAYLHHDNAEWRYNTIRNSYGWAIHNWIIPHLGEWRIDLLEQRPDAIEKFLKSIAKQKDDPFGTGLAPASVHLVFRILRAALNWARTVRKIGRNPVDHMSWKPKNKEAQVTPLFVEEIKAIIRVCLIRPNGTRWIIGMTLGLRQGEALGLTWMVPATSTKDVPMGLDLAGWLVVAKQTERRAHEHGCKDPHACALRHCRTKPCPPRWAHGCGKDPAQCTNNRTDRCPQRTPVANCTRHRNAKSCVKICRPNCTQHAKACPQRIDGGIILVDPKSDASNRRVALAPPMVGLAVEHKAWQDSQRAAAGDSWHDLGLVWCQKDGRPTDARADWAEWKEICRLAGVRKSRIHDGRHAAATMLLLIGVDEQTVMAIMGWSDRRMVQRYQHVIDDLRQAASHGLGLLLWGPSQPAETAPQAVLTQPVGAAAAPDVGTGSHRHDQEGSTETDQAHTVAATNPATSDTDAKIIAFNPSRKRNGKRHLTSVNGNAG